MEAVLKFSRQFDEIAAELRAIGEKMKDNHLEKVSIDGITKPDLAIRGMNNFCKSLVAAISVEAWQQDRKRV